ncbi:metalloregulator ArsR/SmtB family transcription factor [Bacillus sp. B15-48]|uniref:ArsR/SmtB family transcription factor n=1 Tax=Bacillus sp. B15-48 TaxID=1548601 RepID=UPI00193F59E9|nr:metalloregulator ArsR/SmtB family transcription factor [Bacillus sp. B15-48]MBM4760854.1 metalloregulator ArsR/SmtB family transcription factor [Bacillus sp. B15-48]
MGDIWKLKSTEQMRTAKQEAEKEFPMIVNNAELERNASLFKGLADETRLKIIALLSRQDLCMCEIVAALDGANSTISHHLKILEKGGLIESRREGRFTVYQVNKDTTTVIHSILTK